MPVPLYFLHFKPFKLGYIPEKNSAHGWSLHSMRGLGGGEWTPDMGNRLQRQWSRSTVPVTSFCNVSHTLTHIADPPLVDLTNVVRMRSVKGYTEEFSFAGVNLIFLLIIIVLSILCLNFLIIGISVVIWRWKFLRQCLSRKSYFSKEWKGEEESLCTFPASVAGSALRAPWWGAPRTCPHRPPPPWAPWPPARTQSGPAASGTRRRLLSETVNTQTPKLCFDHKIAINQSYQPVNLVISFLGVETDIERKYVLTLCYSSISLVHWYYNQS